MSMIRRVMIESCSIRVIMKSRKSWFKTMAEVREWVMSMLVRDVERMLLIILSELRKGR